MADRSLALTNLPVKLTNFIGREREIAYARGLLPSARLLTVTGPGGIGKSRLAVEVVAGLLDSYPDGVWLVELAGLTEPGSVPQAVAAVLGLREESGRDLTTTIGEHLRSLRLLLLLDNCEHLPRACASLAAELLRTALDLTIIATSRQPLAVEGEMVWQVPSLSLPASMGMVRSPIS
ncbi:MAG: AAA family ATPase [Chloroflexota bacterium]|nr:AAA family ATPase [Chloroflexota bacterium]